MSECIFRLCLGNPAAALWIDKMICIFVHCKDNPRFCGYRLFSHLSENYLNLQHIKSVSLITLTVIGHLCSDAAIMCIDACCTEALLVLHTLQYMLDKLYNIV